jgi:hypothetical protein
MVGALEVGSSVGDPVSMQWQQLSFALPIFPPKLPYVGQPAVICHGLVSASHLNGRGIGRSERDYK